jgi:purine-cytosine permease-like protein
MRMQGAVTVITAILTIVYVALTVDQVHWSRATSSHPSGGAPQIVGVLVLFMTAFGLGWINAAADYSRYLPRSASRRAVAWWTTFGGALAPLLLLVFGLLLAGSSPKLSDAIGADPIGALATQLPNWFLVPFLIVAVLGLVGGAVLDIYSSGLSLLAFGLPAPRWAAALLDGVLMIAGAAYIVFVAQDFVGQFIGFLTTLGVPIAAWGGVMIADVLLRRRDYDASDLYRRDGRYGDVRVGAVAVVLVATAIGWGLVTNAAASWLTWQGYLLDPLGFGGKQGDWAGSSVGVLVALAIGLVGGLVLARRHPEAR